MSKNFIQTQENNEYRFIEPTWLNVIAENMTTNAKKYPDETWRGIPPEEHAARALRHLNLYRMGDTSENHLVNASVRCMMAFETDRKRKLQVPDKAATVENAQKKFSEERANIMNARAKEAKAEKEKEIPLVEIAIRGAIAALETTADKDLPNDRARYLIKKALNNLREVSHYKFTGENTCLKCRKPDEYDEALKQAASIKANKMIDVAIKEVITQLKNVEGTDLVIASTSDSKYPFGELKVIVCDKIGEAIAIINDWANIRKSNCNE